MNTKAISEVFDKFEAHVRQNSDFADLEFLLLRMNSLLKLLERRLATLENRATGNLRANGNAFRS